MRGNGLRSPEFEWAWLSATPFYISATHISTDMDMKLRLVQFESGGRQRVGVELEDGGSVVDVAAVDPAIPSDMRSFLEQWERSVDLAARAVEKAESTGEHTFLSKDFSLKAPIYDPQKVIGIGMNYADHWRELGTPMPENPVVFSKFSSAITEPNGSIVLPDEAEKVDYEVELAFIICKQGKHIKESEAMSYVAGFTVAHDVTARDWQMEMHKNGGQWLIGKTFDTFCPLGPAIVTRAALSDPHKLGIRCRLNGELVQNSNTDQLMRKTEALIVFLSRFMTLQPGDVVLTGTPPGVGCFRKPPLWLKKGDVVECEVDEIGKIVNAII